jgi:peptidoglycan/LPS O-acetylase OafA/YrhL
LETIFRYTFVSIPWITIAVIGIGVLGLGMMLWKLWRAFSENTPRWTLLVIGYTAAIMTTVGILFNPFRTGAADAYNSQRYFFFIGFAVATIVLGGALRLPPKRRVLKYVAISLLSIGIVCDFILPGQLKYDWSRASTCIGGPMPCVVSVGVPGDPDWWIRWPGPNGTYDQMPLWPPFGWSSSG